jgi:hypothetical protein
MEYGWNVADAPVNKSPPKNSVDSEVGPPTTLRLDHVFACVTAELFAGVATVETNMSRGS